MRRGEIRWVELDPVVGSGSGKRRPGVIVTNDRANMTARRLGRGVITVVPVISNTARVGQLTAPQLAALDGALRLHRAL